MSPLQQPRRPMSDTERQGRGLAAQEPHRGWLVFAPYSTPVHYEHARCPTAVHAIAEHIAGTPDCSMPVVAVAADQVDVVGVGPHAPDPRPWIAREPQT